MRNKTMLVAHREYMENIRTKAFWFGILLVPVIIALSVVVMIWFEKTKDVRHYAIVDHSEWLAEAVEQRAALPDLSKAFAYALGLRKEGGESFATLAEPLQGMAMGLEIATRELVREREQAAGAPLDDEERAALQALLLEQ